MSGGLAIAGVGIHQFGRNEDVSGLQMAVSAARAALADAGVGWPDIQFAVGGSDSAGKPDTMVSRLGLTGLPFTNVINGCATGGASLLTARAAISSGTHELGLVVGFDKHARGAFDPRPEDWGLGGWYGDLGLMLTTQYFGIKIQRYMHDHGISATSLARVAAKAFRNGERNPAAWRRKPLPVDDILASPMVADPLTQYMFCSPSAGAVALGAITWPPEHGGAGLPAVYADAFGREEARFAVPRKNELFSVTLELVAPTIAAFGTPAQQRELIPRLLAAEVFVCQLFSEPGAGSDLASLSLRAERRGGGWVLNGQKVWTSGARHAALGELIARTDPGQARHRGLTAFLVPMDAPGVEIRPIRQMSGGSSFNEVFFTDVVVADEARLGEVGQGWQVAMATLGFERAASGAGARQPGGSFAQLVATARELGVQDDPLVRQMLADLYVWSEVQRRYAEKMTQSAAAGQPGEEGSVLKLMWSANLMRTSAVVTELLGPRLIADTGEPGTFGWSEHLLGAPGSPGGLTDAQPAGRVHLAAPPVPRGTIPRADVAAVIAALLGNPGGTHQTLELVGGDTPVGEAVRSVAIS